MIKERYEIAKEQYAALGVDTDLALQKLRAISISLHCWQGDDVGGFERVGSELTGGGIMATGSHPGKARTISELRSDIEKALSLIPGQHRLNLHACYLDNGGKFVDRNEISIDHFQSWVDWAKANRLGLDFNPTFFSHPKAADGFTLSHADSGIRQFWIEHGIACREIAAQMGRQLNTPAVTNVWIPDGFKDAPADKKAPRERLIDSLDKIFARDLPANYNLDAVESKLFGIGAESYTVGSHEFYMGYALSRKKLLCLDSGHFHPTEVISDKISAILNFIPELLLHVSRPIRWDSDHVVILDDELRAIARELVTGDFLARTHIGLDFFDASINRIAAWAIGTRCMIKALLIALLEPTESLRQAELAGDYTARLVIQEELKTMPYGAIWDQYCLEAGVPVGFELIKELKNYENIILPARS